MSMRIARGFAVLSFLFGTLVAGSGTAQTPQTDEQKTVYALGLAVAQNLRAFDLTPDEVKMVAAGLTAGLTNQKPLVDVKDYQEKLDALAATRSAGRAKGEREASTKFMADAANQKGAQKKTSGLVYLETKAGSGENPTAKDKVTVHYTGKLRDGTVFDSSIARGQPADFPLARMIPCWLEGLQLMKPGGKAVITCPADLAYGDEGIPPGSGDRIPPGAALQFDVELISVEKNAGGEMPPKPVVAPPKM
jgi:FKBP-type peptidyl-prolyl cis-trans isomerase FkpA